MTKKKKTDLWSLVREVPGVKIAEGALVLGLVSFAFIVAMGVGGVMIANGWGTGDGKHA